MDVAGHRTVPHTADVAVEAWAPTVEECLAQAVLGTVAAFLDSAGAAPQRTHDRHLVGDTDEELLAAVLDEVVYLLETTGDVPVEVTVRRVADGLDVHLGTTAVGSLEQVGAVPKAVSLHGLTVTERATGWWCAVTLDV